MSCLRAYSDIRSVNATQPPDGSAQKAEGLPAAVSLTIVSSVKKREDQNQPLTTETQFALTLAEIFRTPLKFRGSCEDSNANERATQATAVNP